MASSLSGIRFDSGVHADMPFRVLGLQSHAGVSNRSFLAKLFNWSLMNWWLIPSHFCFLMHSTLVGYLALVHLFPR